MTTAALDFVLTREQQDHLACLLQVAKDVGHGEVYVRVANGVERFVGLRLEETFDPDRAQSKIVAIAK